MTIRTLLLVIAPLSLAACGTCMRSVETPQTVGSCEDWDSGPVCVQEVDGPNTTASTYVRGVDFLSTTVELELRWCAEGGDCTDTASRGRALVVVVDHTVGDQTIVEANCNQRVIQQTFNNVEQIEIVEAGNLSPINTECGGNHVTDGAFGRWEICEPDLAASVPGERVGGLLARTGPPTGVCADRAAWRRVIGS